MAPFQWKRKKRSERFGQKAEIKTFYENVVDSDQGPQWVEWAPPMYPRANRDRWEGYALQTYRKCDDLWDPLSAQSFSLSHVRILSPHLRNSLKPLLQPYDVSFEESYVHLSVPLQPLYCERNKIQELHDNAEGQEKEHFELLLKFMQDELGSTLEETEDLDQKNQITHRLLWTLFPKGSIVVQQLPEVNGSYRAWRVIHSSRSHGATGSYEVTCEYIRFDGIAYGTGVRTLTIPWFIGRRDISTLPVFPIKRLGDAYEQVKKKLIDRGREILQYQDVHYMGYSGFETSDSESGPGTQEQLGDIWDRQSQMRVIIDFQLSRKRGATSKVEMLKGYFDEHDEKPRKKPPESERGGRPGTRRSQPLRRKSNDGIVDGCDCRDCQRKREDKGQFALDTVHLKRLTPDERQRNANIVSADEVNLLLLDPYLDGFSLSSKQWQSFNIERIQPLNLNSEALDFLVHAEENKSLVCAVVENNAAHSLVARDVIAGKGQGLLLLLSGNPGTGKTLMAEAIADRTQRPLLYVDSRDLGEPSRIETSLNEMMSDAAAWNAILLLDEADVYLQQRRGESLDRNKNVAVFLRLLEYYKGIMFLTTNLWETIDEAVESRIQIHLRFPDLDCNSRSQIWRKFLSRSGPKVNVLSADEIERIGEWVINGRQIRNVLRMAEAWSMQRNQPLDFDMMEKVIPSSCPKAYKEGSEPPEGAPDRGTHINGTHIARNGSLKMPKQSYSVDLLTME